MANYAKSSKSDHDMAATGIAKFFQFTYYRMYICFLLVGQLFQLDCW